MAIVAAAATVALGVAAVLCCASCQIKSCHRPNKGNRISNTGSNNSSSTKDTKQHEQQQQQQAVIVLSLDLQCMPIYNQSMSAQNSKWVVPPTALLKNDSAPEMEKMERSPGKLTRMRAIDLYEFEIMTQAFGMRISSVEKRYDTPPLRCRYLSVNVSRSALRWQPLFHSLPRASTWNVCWRKKAFIRPIDVTTGLRWGQRRVIYSACPINA